MFNAKAILESVLKNKGLDKFVTDVKLYREGDVIDSEFRVTIANNTDNAVVGFNVTAPYDAVLATILKFV